MKKVIRVADLHTLDSRKSKNALVVIARNGKGIWTQNLELSGAEITADLDKDEVCIKFRLRDGEYLVLQDEEGSPDKMKYDSRTKAWSKM